MRVSRREAWLLRTLCAIATPVILVSACVATDARNAEPGPGQVVRGGASVPPADKKDLRGRVAYSTRSGDIWVMNADGTHRTQVTRSGAGHDFDPHLSPDARAIVFRTSRGRYLPDTQGIGLEGIFVVDVRSKRARPIHPRVGGLFPSWSPDGKTIAFSTLQAHGETIRLVTPRGKKIRDLIDVRTGAVQEGLAWSPDSRRIAYNSHRGDGNWAIWVMNRDGSGKRQLTHPKLVEPRGSGGDAIGAWSPDGTRLVYSSGQFDGRELYLMNSDGSGVRRLTDWPGADGPVAWLPSGDIVFAHSVEPEPLPRWFIVRPDGSNLRSLPWFDGAGSPLDWIFPR